ncbi:MAG: hypothetical protein PHS66_02475 [Candidatus Omnitrophica bacterium]|nr:hypothetical protein [Candidatus Omnitrophota bacterium]
MRNKGGIMGKVLFLTVAMLFVFVAQGFCEIKYIGGYTKTDGTYVSGHFKDTSGDGVKWNNANELGYNK